MVTHDSNNRRKDLGYDIIYEDTAKSLGILDKIKDNPWFLKYRATLKDGSKIVYYKVNYIYGKYPWRKSEKDYTSFQDIIRQYIQESNSTMFVYNPDDFNKAVKQIEQYLEDCKKEKGMEYKYDESYQDTSNLVDNIYVIQPTELLENGHKDRFGHKWDPQDPYKEQIEIYETLMQEICSKPR